MALKVITPPAIEPVTLTEAKLHSRVDGTTEDALITALIVSGRELAEKFQNRAYITQTLEVTYDGWPNGTIITLPMPPLIDVVRIRYYDTDNNDDDMDAADYFVDTDSEPGRVSLAYDAAWPSIQLRPINGVQIRFEAGYGALATDVPQNVKDAILLYVNYRYHNRESEREDAPVQFYNLLWPDRVVPV